MAIAIVGAATTASSSGVCAKPTGVVSGNVLVAFTQVYNKDVTTWASSGWTVKIQTSETGGPANSDLSAAILYKVAGGSEPASYTFTQSGSTGDTTVNVIIAAYSGVDNTTPIDTATANNSAGNNATVTGTGFSASQAGERLLFAWLGDDSALGAAPTGSIGSLTPRVDGTTFLNLDGGFSGFYDGALSGSGATGNYTATAAPADTWIVIMVGLNPAPPGGCSFPAAAMHYVTP